MAKQACGAVRKKTAYRADFARKDSICGVT
jgi:hypothetical protein